MAMIVGTITMATKHNPTKKSRIAALLPIEPSAFSRVDADSVLNGTLLHKLALWAGGHYFVAASRMAEALLRAVVRAVSWVWVRGTSWASMPSFTPGITTAA